MLPILLRALSRYAPYITLPVAAVVGVIGYHLEDIMSDKYTPSEKRFDRFCLHKFYYYDYVQS